MYAIYNGLPTRKWLSRVKPSSRHPVILAIIVALYSLVYSTSKGKLDFITFASYTFYYIRLSLIAFSTLEVWGTLRASGNRVASNWSRSCISADDNYVAAGSVDGSVHIWSISNGNIVSTLKENTGSVLCCSWSGLGKPLATSDKNGIICMWT